MSGDVTRVLVLSWEYPPIVEGGLARHVRKLSEALVARGIEVAAQTAEVYAELERTRPRVRV